MSGAPEGKRGTVWRPYKPDGTRTTPTFRTGDDSSAIAIDANGKIYVTNDTGPGGKSSVTTYLPDGSPTTPTITQRIHRPDAVAVAKDGTIFVANTNNRGHDGTGAGFVTSCQRRRQRHIAALRSEDSEQAPGGIAEAHGNVYLGSSSAYLAARSRRGTASRRTDRTDDHDRPIRSLPGSPDRTKAITPEVNNKSVDHGESSG